MPESADSAAHSAFRGTADDYDRCRPPYPSVLFEDLKRRSGITGHGRLLDVACGTGHVALPMAPAFREVVAVDLEPDMTAFAAARAHRLGIVNVTFDTGPVETLEVAGPFELVTIGNAFHRLDRTRIAGRVAAWLQPGGHVALLWSHVPWTGDEPWQQQLADVVEAWWPAARDVAPLPEASRSTREVLEGAGLTWTGRFEYPDHRRWTIDQLVGFLYSTSTHSRRRLGSRAAEFETELRLRLGAVGDPFEERRTCALELAYRAGAN